MIVLAPFTLGACYDFLGNSKTVIHFVQPHQAQEKLKSGNAILIDLREASEFDPLMPEPARWIAYSEIRNKTLLWDEVRESLPKGPELIFCCKNGKNAEIVAKMLKHAGYETSTMGACDQWEKAGLPTKRP